LSILVWALPAVADRCYVNHTASGTNSGASWTDSYTSLQAALVEVDCTEVWTAKGAYKPVVPAILGAVALPERAVSFNINPGVAVYGGFAGGEVSLSARDPATHLTVLSGDIDNNDDSNNADGNAITESYTEIVGSNSQHVVVMNRTGAVPISASTILDGLESP